MRLLLQGAFVGLQSEEMRRAADEYKVKEEELRALAESGDLLAVRGSAWDDCSVCSLHWQSFGVLDYVGRMLELHFFYCVSCTYFYTNSRARAYTHTHS